MANVLNIKHDKITRELSMGNYDTKFLWEKVKVYVQELKDSKNIVTLSFDDSIEEKSYTDEGELNCWHYDHCFNRLVKGVNFLTALAEIGTMKLSVNVEFVKKDTREVDAKTGKTKRKASVTKNELFRKMLRDCNSKLIFDYVLADSWYSSSKNMICCKSELNRNFIMALKNNRADNYNLQKTMGSRGIS